MTNPTPTDVNTLIERLEVVKGAGLASWAVETIDEAAQALRAMQARVGEWQSIETAPKDRPILVWFDHDADPYSDPEESDKLTAYACHAEGGDFLSGAGIAIAHWSDGWHETVDEYGSGYWMPAVWLAWFNGDFADHVLNPIHWMPHPPPSTQQEAQRHGE